MQTDGLFTVALLLAMGGNAAAQNTGARATPQIQGAAPAPGGTVAEPPARGATSRGDVPRQAGRGAGAGGPRSGGVGAKSQQPAAAAANASVGVIGDSNGDGTLDRSGRGSDNAALPGVVMSHNALGVAIGTPIQVRLQQTIDSGHAHNGDTVRGVLAAPLGRLPTGAEVGLTVVAAAAAGQLASSGVLSLQVISINGQQILSQVVTAEGQEGKKGLADDAPERGTEATFTSDQPITLPAA